MRGEAVHLHAVNFAAGEGATESIDRDVLRLDVAGGLEEPPVKCGGLDLALLPELTERGVFAEQRQNVQATADEIGEVTPQCLAMAARRIWISVLSSSAPI